MKINLNTKVRVRLTPQGKLVMTYWFQKINKFDSPEHNALHEAEVQEFPLWKFMAIFEGYTIFRDTGQDYFPDGIEIVEEGSPENGQV